MTRRADRRTRTDHDTKIPEADISEAAGQGQAAEGTARHAVERLHPLLAGVAFSHLANGDDVSIVDGNVMIEFGANRCNIDGPAVLPGTTDPEAILAARFDGEPVDADILAALIRRTLAVPDVSAVGPAPTEVFAGPHGPLTEPALTPPADDASGSAGSIDEPAPRGPPEGRL
jgi:hypothetical protein